MSTKQGQWGTHQLPDQKAEGPGDDFVVLFHNLRILDAEVEGAEKIPIINVLLVLLF